MTCGFDQVMGARNTSFVAHDSLLPSLAVENFGKSFDRESFVDLFILRYFYFLDLEKVCRRFIKVFQYVLRLDSSATYRRSLANDTTAVSLNFMPRAIL
mmetsp:Transcript_3511/g.5097  ORF Transcript_3511/g.5097 Transcript_3511/m.5097 type:complete len:99 (-) Transcript_3511:246-542(-)